MNKEIDQYLLQLKDGDKSAISLLYDATCKPLYTLCYSYLKNNHDAEDALSDAYFKIAKEILSFSGKNGFNWMYTITKNVCLNAVKKLNRIRHIDLQDEKTVNFIDSVQSDEISISDESGIISTAKTVLKENEFEILIMHAVHGYKFQEIALFKGKIEATIRWQYNNAIKKIQKHVRRCEL